MDEGVVVITVTNDISPEFNAIHERVKRMAFEPLDPAVPPEVPARVKTPPVSLYAGRYRSSPSAAFHISVDGDRLVLRPVGQDAINFLTGAGAMLLAVYWNGPKIIEMSAGTPEPYRAVLIPRSDAEFVGYHPGLETVLKVSFGRAPGGRESLLTVTTSHGTVSVPKEGP